MYDKNKVRYVLCIFASRNIILPATSGTLNKVVHVKKRETTCTKSVLLKRLVLYENTMHVTDKFRHVRTLSLLIEKDYLHWLSMRCLCILL